MCGPTLTSTLQRERALVDAAPFEREHFRHLLLQLRRDLRIDIRHERLVRQRADALCRGDRVVDLSRP